MSTQLATLPPAALSRQVEPAQWNALKEIYDGASDEKVALVVDYCRARKLDPLKKPVHIVQTWSQKRNAMVETIWPSISEVRITAMRTGNFVGLDETKFGPTITQRVGSIELTFPEWAQITVHRTVKVGDIIQSAAFPGPRTYWIEAYSGKGKDPTPNAMWSKRTWGQLEKCAEAAALRRAFPEELGSQYTAEEMHGRTIDDDGDDNPNAQTPAGRPKVSRRGGAEAAAGEVTTDKPAADPVVKKDAAPKKDAQPIIDAETGQPEGESEAALEHRQQLERRNAAQAESAAKAEREAANSNAISVKPGEREAANERVAKVAAEKEAAKNAASAEVDTSKVPEVLPGIGVNGFLGKSYPVVVTGTIKKLTPGAVGTKLFVKVVVDTLHGEFEVVVFNTADTRDNVLKKEDGTIAVNNPALCVDRLIEFNMEPRLRKSNEKGPDGNPLPDLTRAPALIASAIKDAEEIPI